GVGDPVHRGDDRLAARARERHRVDAVSAVFSFTRTTAILHAFRPFREVEPRGEMLPVAEQHAHPELGILVEARVGEAELAHHLRRQAVVLLAPVEPHQQDPAALLDADLAIGMSFALAHWTSDSHSLPITSSANRRMPSFFWSSTFVSPWLKIQGSVSTW